MARKPKRGKPIFTASEMPVDDKPTPSGWAVPSIPPLPSILPPIGQPTSTVFLGNFQSYPIEFTVIGTKFGALITDNIRLRCGETHWSTGWTGKIIVQTSLGTKTITSPFGSAVVYPGCY